MAGARDLSSTARSSSAIAAAVAAASSASAVTSPLSLAEAAGSDATMASNDDCALAQLPDEVKWIIDANLTPSARANLAATCRAYFSFFNQTLVKTIDPTYYNLKTQQPNTYQPYIRFYRKRVQKFLDYVVRGEQSKVEAMIAKDPGLLLAKGIARDYTKHAICGRNVQNNSPITNTAFQMALRTGDNVMAKMLKAAYLKLDPINGQARINKEFIEVFPHGYDAHLREQEERANEFERDYLQPLLAALKEASMKALRAALNKNDNGSALYAALTTFRVGFTALSHNEKVFNPYHLLKVIKMYHAQLDALVEGSYHSMPCYYLPLDLFWIQVIGWEQRFMPVNYAQAFCTGLRNMAEGWELLKRTLKLHNYVPVDHTINFFPFDVDPSSRLGWDFAVFSNYSAAGEGKARTLTDAAWFVTNFTKLMSSKNIGLSELMHQPQPKPTTGCVIS